MAVEQWLRAFHMIFAILWVGGALYRGTVIERLMAREPDFDTRFFARAIHGPYMGVTAILTVAFGFARMGMAWEGAYSLTVLGNGFYLFWAAAMLGVLALLLGLIGHLPTDVKLKPIARARLAGEPHDEQRYVTLRGREAALQRVSLLLIMGAAVGMVAFRAAA